MENYDRIAALIVRMKLCVITDEERAELSEWAGESEENLSLFDAWLGDADLQKDYLAYSGYDNVRAQKELEKIVGSLRADVAKRPLRRRWLWTAVAAVAACAAIVLFVVPRVFDRSNPPLVSLIPAEKIVLHLDDRTIELDNAKVLSADGQLKVIMTDGSEQLIESGQPDSNAMLFATVVVPKGRVFEMRLDDGSRVWLNADSKLKYPLTFGTDSREVELTGEGYFEVAEDRGKPFRITTGGQRTEVLGTEFNVKAYPGAPVFTTLLEGSVQVTRGGDSRVLTPGQQSVLTAEGLSVHNIKAEYIAGWRNDMFVLEGQTLEQIMATLGRWYDFEVVYRNESVRGVTFSGLVPRYDSIEKVLDILQRTHEVKFTVKGNMITVE